MKQQNKKSQLKIQEMSFMIIAVVLFFVLVSLFLFSAFYSNAFKNFNRLAEDKTLSAITNLAKYPEFICTGFKSNCIDSDKLISLVDKKDYNNFWPFSSLIVIKSSSFNKSEDEMIDCTPETYPNCDRFVIFSKKVKNQRSVSSYVALCRSEYENGFYEKCEIARLIAGTEIQ